MPGRLAESRALCAKEGWKEVDTANGVSTALTSYIIRRRKYVLVRCYALGTESPCRSSLVVLIRIREAGKRLLDSSTRRILHYRAR